MIDALNANGQPHPTRSHLVELVRLNPLVTSLTYPRAGHLHLETAFTAPELSLRYNRP